MAVYADQTLPKTLPSPLKPPASQQKVPSLGFQPPRINDATVSAAVNNKMAAGVGAGRAALAETDRAGVSRGKGQQRLADMADASADTQARAGAIQTEMEAAAANSAAQREFENTMRAEQLGDRGLLEGLRTATAMERIQKKGWQQDLYEAMRRGQFGLDSIYLDRTPLFEALLRQGG